MYHFIGSYLIIYDRFNKQLTEENKKKSVLTHLCCSTVSELMYQKILLSEVPLPTFKATEGSLPRVPPTKNTITLKGYSFNSSNLKENAESANLLWTLR